MNKFKLMREAQIYRLRILLGNIFRDDKMMTRLWSLSHLHRVFKAPGDDPFLTE